ncbi:ABC transporter ATP-binding protein/permease [Rheinheimera sp. F8]|uniref:ABCB family ABC transporter ATP-binding protein/permease n=1 Tax=Rheinheimera sp. F8 TaxID=1763998 RepID=UPI000744867F|nr:ABC transporter ATP-binding protein/permease [Rheinheimera sp. F8]ALZ74372.1 metal ABC transporter permease [Rheinheimera sp. F8]
MRGMRSTAKQPEPSRRPEAASLSETIRYMRPYFAAFPWHVTGAILALIAAKAATLALPYGLKLIIDALDPSLNSLALLPLWLILGYGLLRFGSVLFGEVRDALFGRVTEHAMRALGLKVFMHLHRLELGFHLDRQTGGISRDIERGTNGLSFLMRFLMFNIVPTVLEIVLVALIFWNLFSVWYAVITAVAVAVYILFTVRVTEWRNQFIRAANQADSSTNTQAVDSLLNYETVKYFNNEQYEASRYDESLAAWEKARLQNRMSLFFLNSGQALIIALAMTLMMLLAAQGVAGKQLTLGDLAMVNAYMLQLFMPLNFLGFVYREIRRALTDLENMLGLLKRAPVIADEPDATALQLQQARVEFRDVAFAYQPERPILNGLNFTIESGQRVAIVGSSGAGKSTLARLLYRFYDLQSGQILLDGADIRSVTLDSLRRNIAIVPQDTVLFNQSIRANIAYGRPDATDADIDAVIDAAHLRDFINQLPQGDATLVGERGLKVSGGEKQRIAIARALLKRSPLLIFDEATSALDSHSEQAVMAAIRAASREHTALVIAHRLSTVVDCDRILVLEQGQLVESGSHAELLAQQGRYAALWALQQHEEDVTED